MNETHVTIAGNVATPVDYRTSSTGLPVARFRLATTVRRFDRQKGSWSDAFTSFYTVWAWRALASNVASSISRGDPVVVRGQLRILEEEREGKRLLAADLMASTIGHDLSRGTSAFLRAPRAGELTRQAGPAQTPSGMGPADPWSAVPEPVAAAVGTAPGTAGGEDGVTAEGDVPGQRPMP